MDVKNIQIIKDDFLSIDDRIKKILIDSQMDPFIICNLGDVVKKLINWRQVFPLVQSYYVVQCNNFLPILELLAALNSSFFCASEAEIRTILDLNVDPDRIIFGNPMKPISHLKYAAKVGVSLLVFDNEKELLKIKDHHPNAKLILRINVSENKNDFHKFGCDLKTEILELLNLAKTLNLNIVGISFHLGSYTKINPQQYINAIKLAKKAFDLGSSLGFKNMDILNIGGGFPNDISEIAKCINETLNQFFPSKTIKFIAEPGTYLVQSSFQLAANIHSKRTTSKPINSSTNEIQQMYYINTGVYQMLMPIYYHSAKYNLKPLNPNKEKFKSIVWGPTCDALDKLADCWLPEMFIDDWVVIENIGAYTWSQATNWNGFLIPKVYCVIQEKYYLLLKDLCKDNGLLSKFIFIKME